MLDKRFIIVGGKGGVGRTVVAASLATLLARHGRRVLLAHVRTKQRMTRLLGCDVVDENVRPVEPNLWVVNMNPRAALMEQGLKVLRFKAVYRAVMENRLVKYFLKAIPSLDEYSMLGKAWYHTTQTIGEGHRFDTVVFDGPATGHLITMLRIPRVVLDVVPEGPLTADAQMVWNLLTDPARTGLWIVTLAEEMAVNESVDLFTSAREDLGIATDRLVVNALFPDVFERDRSLAEALDRLHGAAHLDPALAATVESAESMRRRRCINRQHLDTLEEVLPIERVELPHLFAPEMDRTCIDQIASVLESAMVP